MIPLVESEGPDQTAEAQADLGLRRPHMPEDTFSHGPAYMWKRARLKLPVRDGCCILSLLIMARLN